MFSMEWVVFMSIGVLGLGILLVMRAHAREDLKRFRRQLPKLPSIPPTKDPEGQD